MDARRPAYRAVREAPMVIKGIEHSRKNRFRNTMLASSSRKPRKENLPFSFIGNSFHIPKGYGTLV